MPLPSAERGRGVDRGLVLKFASPPKLRKGSREPVDQPADGFASPSSPPAEVDHDLEIPVKGEPKPASLLKLADDYARLFKLAGEQRLGLVEGYAIGKLIINGLLRQRRGTGAGVAVAGMAFAESLACRSRRRRALVVGLAVRFSFSLAVRPDVFAFARN